MEIRVLTFDGCPTCGAVSDLVRETIRELHIEADFKAVNVRNERQARRHRFLGSPTIQVDGRDIEPARRNDQVSLACRLYRTSDGVTGVPSKQLLVDAITGAVQDRR
jgi:hypothetical protein